MTRPDCWGFSARNWGIRIERDLVKDFYEVLRFRWAEGGRAIWRLFGPQCRGDDEGNKPRLDPQLHKVFSGDGREV